MSKLKQIRNLLSDPSIDPEQLAVAVELLACIAVEAYLVSDPLPVAMPPELHARACEDMRTLAITHALNLAAKILIDRRAAQENAEIIAAAAIAKASGAVH